MKKNLMNILFILFSLCAVHAKAYAQTLDFNQSSFEEDEYLIELPYQKVKGKIVIDVTIGDQVYKFILDTGAPTAMRRELSQRLGLEILSSEDMTDINGNKGAFEVANIKTLFLAGSSVRNIPSVVIDDNPMTECLKVDGLIGSNLFHSSVIQFDDRNRLIRISNTSKKLDLSEAHSYDIFIDKQSSPIITIELGEQATEMLLFDTGDDCLYAMADDSRRKFKKTKTFTTVSKSTGSTSLGIHGLEQQSKKYRLLIPEFNVQGLTIKNVLSETTTGLHSRVGSQLLEYGVFTIYYANSKSYFQVYSQESAARNSFWDLSPTFMAEHLVIGRVWNKKIKNIRVGD